MEWISVEERMPEIGKSGFSDTVLVFDNIESCVLSAAYDEEFGWSSEPTGYLLIGVTHWRPMIESPEGERIEWEARRERERRGDRRPQ
jgi:hypothetical protein